MLHVLTGLMALYLLWRLVWGLNWSKRNRIVVSVVFLLLTQFQLFNRLWFGSIASPEWPAGVLIATGWLFGSMMVASALLLISDGLGLAGRALRRWRLGRGARARAEVGEAAGPTERLLGTAAGLSQTQSKQSQPSMLGDAKRRNQSGLGWRWGLTLVAMALTAFGVREAIRIPDVRTLEITLPGLPADMDGLRLVQLTDLHASRLLQEDWMAGVVTVTNALQPDMIVLTGDLADGSVEARFDDMMPLAELRAPLGVYAIPGNHEYYTEYRPWIQRLHELNLHLLLNDQVVIQTEGGRLVLAGITDPAAERFQEVLPSTAAALRGVAPDDPIILLSHRPTGAHSNAYAGADLQLSGHTHGGQIAGMHWVTQLANQGYVSGLYQVGDMQLYVSNGAGLWNGLPVRLGRPSEITEIVLRAGQ